MESARLKKFLRDTAFKLGFNAVGVSRVRLIPPEKLTTWLDRDYHGQMSYMERNLEKRLNPGMILAGTRSVVSVALNYSHMVEMPYSCPEKGVVSRYARGLDYHLVLEKRLNELLRMIVTVEPKTVGKVYVDTGPVMDKFWAVESGVGWLGKHSNVLSRSNGSWFFLGEMLLNIELEPDSPVRNYCGSCTRCIDACPTNAIVEPYVVDARKCLSYSTIELKEEVPEDLRDATSNLIFGCDICQEVCPWNRKAPDSQVEEFMGPARDYSLKALSRLTPEQFNKAFRRSPVKRAKWRGLMRNVAVAMANSGAHEMIPELSRLLNCKDPVIGLHADWALEKIKGTRTGVESKDT